MSVEYGTYPWLREEVGAALGFGRDPTVDAFDDPLVDSVIQSGYMQALYPPPLGAPRDGAPAPKPHRWSFLTPIARLSVRAGEASYRLPDDFSGVVGEMTVA